MVLLDPVITGEMMYKTRALDFLGDRIHVVYQNVNGPCPLLAICNVLLLKKLINLKPDAAGEVSHKTLVDLVKKRVLHASNCGDLQILNREQRFSDAIDVLKDIGKGINVNVTFNRVDGFEFTSELEIFYVLGIALYHGWIVNPEDTCIVTAIGSNSYNALKSGPVKNGDAERELIDDFLLNTSNQLTDHGLDRLHEDLKEEELCVFFCNNHFNTMFKYTGSLYLLATDDGFLQTDLVWQKLEKVNGYGGFVTSNFTSLNDDAKLAKDLQQGDDAKLAKDLQEGDDAKLARALA